MVRRGDQLRGLVGVDPRGAGRLLADVRRELGSDVAGERAADRAAAEYARGEPLGGASHQLEHAGGAQIAQRRGGGLRVGRREGRGDVAAAVRGGDQQRAELGGAAPQDLGRCRWRAGGIAAGLALIAAVAEIGRCTIEAARGLGVGRGRRLGGLAV